MSPSPAVTSLENKVFSRFTLEERQLQYCKAILKKKPATTDNGLTEALAWKFGKCILKPATLSKLVN